MKKTIYIPKGETCEFDTLTCEKLVVNGKLKVNGFITAKQICGDGIIMSDTVKADTIVCDYLSTSIITCETVMAKQLSAVEVHASSSISVSTYMEAGYVKTPEATLAEAEIEDMHADEIVKLPPKKRSLWMMLISSALRSVLVELVCALKSTFDDVIQQSQTRDSEPASNKEGKKEHPFRVVKNDADEAA